MLGKHELGKKREFSPQIMQRAALHHLRIPAMSTGLENRATS